MYFLCCEKSLLEQQLGEKISGNSHEKSTVHLPSVEEFHEDRASFSHWSTKRHFINLIPNLDGLDSSGVLTVVPAVYVL